MTKYYTCHGVHFLMRNHQFVDLHGVYLWYSKDSLLADLQKNGFTIDQSDNIVNMPQVQQPTITKKKPKAKKQEYVPKTLPSLKTVSDSWGFFDIVIPINVSKIKKPKYLVEKQNIHGDTIGFIEDYDNIYYIGKMDNVKKAKTKHITTIDEFSNINLVSSENFENTGVKIGNVIEFIISNSVRNDIKNLYVRNIELGIYMVYVTNGASVIYWILNSDTLKKIGYAFPIDISSYKNQYVYICPDGESGLCCNQSYNTFTIGSKNIVPDLNYLIQDLKFDTTVEYSVDDMKRLLAEYKEIKEIGKEIQKIDKSIEIQILIEPKTKLLIVELFSYTRRNIKDSLSEYMKNIINDLGLFEDVSGYYVTEKYKNIKLDLFAVLNFQYIEPFFIEYGNTDCTVQIPKFDNQAFLFTSSTFGEPDTNYIVMPYKLIGKKK
jgi:hypothetical protein